LVKPETSANISKFLGYLCAIFVSYAFSQYLNAGVGWMFFVILTASPVFSVLVTVVLTRAGRIGITTETSANLIYKNETVALRVSVKNNGFLPIPLVLIKMCSPVYLEKTEGKTDVYAVSVAPRSETAFEVVYKVKVWGKCDAGVQNIRLQDFMRFSSFTLYNERGENRYLHKLRIIPNIPDIPADSPLIKSVFDAAWYSDGEDTKESDSLFISGIPGYTHREYEPGDPVKRINWKLSAGRENYLVRLDDEKETVNQTVVLDAAGSSDPYVNERAVEGVLAVVYSLIRLGVESTVWYKKNGLFECFEIESPGDVIALQTAFADYSFHSGGAPSGGLIRIPADELAKGKGRNVLLFTPAPDEELLAEVDGLRNGGVSVTAVSADGEFDGRDSSGLWELLGDYSAVSRKGRV
jgi:hypothetical protein